MEKKIVPILVNFNEAVPMSINRSEAKIGMAWVLIGILFLGAGPLFAAETVKKENVFQKVMAIEKRGVVNFLTSPGELVSAFKTEKKEHPKAWPVTYVPRFFTNVMIRIGSSANDILVLPWNAAAGDTTPLTRHFDLPDYVWGKE